ncbi:MAG: HEAT repeat domain-containing protein, partial [Planctomycetota bacterium]|nr:HEAT repeat domain-containing protein [Planctomycetota bacterium]
GARAPIQSAAAGQGKRQREITPERLGRLIRAASQGSPIVRPQAAQRLEKMGPVAHKAVLDHVRSHGDLFGVGPELLEVAAGLATPGEDTHRDLRARFWGHVGERDFPWRAALVAGLGRHAQPDERERFVELLEDRLLAVRLAALKSFASEGSETLLPLVQSRLEKETEDVALRALARRAYELGHAPSLWLLHAERGRSDYFFDQPVGLVARLEAAKFLKALIPDGPEFDAQAKVQTPGAVKQRKAWRDRIEGIAGPKMESAVDGIAPAGTPVLGLELRSCRRGEFFLRWTDQDQLWVGRGQPRCFDLAKGTHESLIVAARGAAAAMGDRHLTGQPGCDQESFHMRLPDSERSSGYLITKGPAPVPNLRPIALHPLLREMMGSLEGPRLPKGLAEDLREALIDLGGDYRPEPNPKTE